MAELDLELPIAGGRVPFSELPARVLARSLAVSASPSAHEIADALAREIIEGELPPGTDLNSVGIAQRFGTSRSPVRDALNVLESRGLVEIPPRRRPRVRAIDIVETREIYGMRALLYSAAVPLFVAHAGDEHLRAMRAIHDRMGEAAQRIDVPSTMWLNVAFREVEIGGTGNHILREMHDVIELRAMILRRRGLTPERLTRSHFDHGRLILAYEERDEETARALSRSIVMRGLASLEEIAARAGNGAHIGHMPSPDDA